MIEMHKLRNCDCNGEAQGQVQAQVLTPKRHNRVIYQCFPK